ncbi:MAG: alkaline phosphatase family protein [Nevskia sp.]
MLCFVLSACGLSRGSGGGSANVPGPAPLAGQCGVPLPLAGQAIAIANSGRRLTPVGRMTKVGNFPTGGAISPDGKFYWSASAGLGTNDLQIVDLASGKVVQKLPMPGTYGQVIFSADGKTAYASGLSKGSSPTDGPTMGDAGDVIHVFAIDPASGTVAEKTPLALPSTQGGSARTNSLPPNPNLPSFPVGMALTADGKTLIVALYNADKAAIINTAAGTSSTVSTGTYPYHVAIERNGRYAYVSNAFDGSLTKIDLTNTGATPATIAGLGGPKGDRNAQPQFVLPDPKSDRLFIAVTDHDGVAVVDTVTDKLTRFIDLKRPEGYGTQPVALALARDGSTLYVAEAGDNAIAAIALSDRTDGSAKAFDVIGKLPTADYTSDVDVTPDGCTLVWTAARGIGAGANPNYGAVYAPGVAPVESYVPALLTGYVGVLPTPSDAAFRATTALVDQALRPDSATPPPADTPLHGVQAKNGSYAPSGKIKHVFYIVKENRTYDQIFGSDTRGNGQASLEVFDDNGIAGPTGGTTPNAHKITRTWSLLDNFYENSEVSTDGHVITSGAYANNYSTKSLHQDYGARGRPFDIGLFPVSFPPNYFMFDQAATQGISFHVYGERSGGLYQGAADTRSTLAQVQANSDAAYASNLFLGCVGSNSAPGYPNVPSCAYDAGRGLTPPLAQSRIDVFEKTFKAQLAANQVPAFNYLIMVSDHTNGNGVGNRSPQSMVADNDLAIGQFIDIVSHSSIWAESAIFIVEDDAQDGPDHIDAHRSVAYVASPYAKRGGQAIHTRYNQVSVIRTIELIIGMQPLSLFDATATPMYDVFTATPNLAPYDAVTPTQSLTALNTASTATAKMSAALPWDVTDAVPQALSDYILWKAVYGEDSIVPVPGPNASPAEHARAQRALELYRKGGDLRAFLTNTRDADD